MAERNAAIQPEQRIEFLPGGGDGFEPSRSLSRKRKPESPSDRFDGSFFCGTDNSDPAFSAGEPSVPANLVRRGLAHYAG
jgi:hypothetical protein